MMFRKQGRKPGAEEEIRPEGIPEGDGNRRNHVNIYSLCDCDI